jgi:ornithine cyclodeaminase/alanine dehydrogenase-like protein (mu-crystallin family)
MGPLILDAAAVRAACGPADAVAAITTALRDGLDPAAGVARATVPLRSGQFLLMPAEHGAHAGVKVVAVAPDNPTRGLPRIQASYLLFDAESLSLAAVLDGTELTTLRTAAVSAAAVASRLTGGTLAVIGRGPQAHGHVAALTGLTTFDRIELLGREPGRMRDVLPTADVVVCATTARTPLFDADLIRDGAVVIAVGSHEPDARELPAALLRRATVVVEDPATALREAGDVCLAIAEGALLPGELLTLRDLITGHVGTDTQRPLVFKSVGMAWEDLVVAEAVLRRHARDNRVMSTNRMRRWSEIDGPDE